MSTNDTEPKQALGSETNPGDEKWLEQEEVKPSLEGEELDEPMELQDWPEERKWHQEDNEYDLIKKCLSQYKHNISTLIDSAKGLGTVNLMHAWFFDESKLTESQKKLNKRLLNILSSYPDTGSVYTDSYSLKVGMFLERNKNNEDLKTVLNLPRGESGFTVLHAIAGMARECGGRVGQEYSDAVGSLVLAGADPNIRNDRGNTILHYAAGSGDLIGDFFFDETDDINAQDSEGDTPLHYAASLGCSESVEELLRKGADSSIHNKQGKTPLQVAIDNHCYHIKGYFLTANQRKLKEELFKILYQCSSGYHNCNPDYGDAWEYYSQEEAEKDEEKAQEKKKECIAQYTEEIRKFLDKYKNDRDLKVILNIQNESKKSEVLDYVRCLTSDREEVTGIEGLLSEAGATDLEKSDHYCRGRKEDFLKPGILWNNLIPIQQRILDESLDKVLKAQDINQLAEVVNQAICSGVRFNFPKRFSKEDDLCNFTDLVIRKIVKLEKSPKAASNILYKLISRGAVPYNNSYDGLIETDDMKKTYADYMNLTMKFMEVAKNAANGKVKNAKMDNSTFYLEYSEDSTIDVAKITEGARSLGLTQGSIEYGRDIIKIGESEVEIITNNDIRHYTDLADGSNIVLTFYTSLGELEVNLYPDKQDKIIVEVSNKKEILEKFKNCKEELGKNCSFGGYSVYDAIEQGCFERSGKLCQSFETISLSKKVSEGVKAAVKGLKCGDIVSSPFSNIFPSKATMQEGKARAPGV